jgi:hypothetical protein
MRARWKLALFGAVLGLCGFLGSSAAWANSVTPMCTTSQGGPFQCIDGWYTTPVLLQWQVTPLPTSSPCADPPEFTSDTNQTVECDATWSAPPNIQYPYQVRVEISSPTATAAPARSPDANGWYNHPVAVSFTGSGFSGSASCKPATSTYSGPVGTNALLTSVCTDPAGKTAAASLALNYDDTPPTITGATPARKPDANGYYTSPVNFRFSGVDAVSGIAGCDTLTYRGPGSGTVTGGCWDRAGNYARISVPVRYRAAAPRASVARAGSSLILRWRGASRASYYNVQIYRGSSKVFSSWPSRTSVVLRRAWSFAGHRFRLKAGRYRWYVWPGYGSRAAARYGRMLVSSSFKVTKRR